MVLPIIRWLVEGLGPLLPPLSTGRPINSEVVRPKEPCAIAGLILKVICVLGILGMPEFQEILNQIKRENGLAEHKSGSEEKIKLVT
jgi:hypothetical protein